MKKLLLLPLLIVSALVLASEPKPVTLAWDYPAAEITSDLVFVLHGSTNATLPKVEWPVIATVPGTATSTTIQVLPGRAFYYLTASNWWGESDPSNVASTPAAPRGDVRLTIRRGN